MEFKQAAAHRLIGQLKLDVTGDPGQQCGIVVAEQVCRHDHHAVKPVETLHQHVAVLIDGCGARFIHVHPFREKRVGPSEEEHGAQIGGAFERLCDAFGGDRRILK